MGPNVHVKWGDDISLLRVLYAYLNPKTRQVLYVGKADYRSVRQRYRGDHKNAMFLDLIGSRPSLKIEVIVGELYFDANRRYSSALLADVESLLIYRLKPPLNRQCINSRISRPGMVVTCSGRWPHIRTRFVDR
jgi:hypothetical protein